MYKLGKVNNVTSIKVAMEKQQCVTFELLGYMSLSTILLWRFYVAGNNETH
jgi:hypothetical protein